MGSCTAGAARSRLRLRLAVLLAAACCAAPLLAPGSAAGGARAGAAEKVLEAATVAQINVVRARNGLVPLEYSRGLFTSAMTHDRQMIEGGYFGHQAPNGSDFAARIEHYYPTGSALYYAIGENLFWTQGPVSVPGLVNRWMGSAEHRANMLNPNWREVGVAVLTVPSAPGVFDDLPVTVVTVDFGVRK